MHCQAGTLVQECVEVAARATTLHDFLKQLKWLCSLFPYGTFEDCMLSTCCALLGPGQAELCVLLKGKSVHHVGTMCLLFMNCPS